MNNPSTSVTMANAHASAAPMRPEATGLLAVRIILASLSFSTTWFTVLALPCLIGWTAGFLPEETIDWSGGWALFAIQFFWQFPHFWAIAWIAHKDYSKAGFRMLPSEEGTTKYSAVQAIIYSLLLIPAGVVPYLIDMSGIVSFGIVLVANVFMIFQCVRLYREMTAQAARRVMFSSYIYLPVVLLGLLLDKVS